mmetsp:Transcript_83895/g.218412  ORF Transcript_83895/g.218412 Transcript_83895/m.218412 type:complete len:222 (-) Transcript_83895:133-798(-)
MHRLQCGFMTLPRVGLATGLVLLLGAPIRCWGSVPVNLTATLPEMVQNINQGKVENTFCWGNGLAPEGRDWKTMFGKVAGCLLHKAEIIAMQWDISDNSTFSIDAPTRFYSLLAADLASCCTLSSRKEWCMEKVGPAYQRLVSLWKVGGEDYETDETELASVFLTVSSAAAELLRDFGSREKGHSEKAGLLLGACAYGGGGAGTCQPSDLERLRRLLAAAG